MIIEFVIQSSDFFTAAENQFFIDNRPQVDWQYSVIPQKGDLIDIGDFVDEDFLSNGPNGKDSQVFGLSFDVSYVCFKKDGVIPIIEICVEGQ